RSATPLTTSFTEPSPPTTTSSRAPPSAACCASSVRCPGRSEKSASPFSPRPAASLASCGQRRPVAPLSEAGLTRKTVLMIGRRGCQRDPGHPIDGGAKLVVRDALELPLDDDVAHGEQRAGVDVPKSAEREQHGRFHLDGENAAPRPPLVL